MLELVPIALVITLAMGFTYTNGVHDAADAIATSVSTRALTPRVAVSMAAVANLVGAFFGAEVAKTIGSGIMRGPRARTVCGSSPQHSSEPSPGTW